MGRVDPIVLAKFLPVSVESVRAVAACVRHLGGSQIGKGTGLDAALRREETEERAQLFFRVKTQTLQSVGRSVSALSNTGCIRPQGGCPSAEGRRMKTLPSLCFIPSLDCLIFMRREKRGAQRWNCEEMEKHKGKKRHLCPKNMGQDRPLLMKSSESQSDINSLAFTGLERSVLPRGIWSLLLDFCSIWVLLMVTCWCWW